MPDDERLKKTIKRYRYVLYSTVSSPLERSKRFTLFLPGRPVHSDTNSASLGSILDMPQLRATTKSLTFPPLSISRYSFKQLSQLGRQWGEQKCPNFETVAKGIRTWAHMIASLAFYRGARGRNKPKLPPVRRISDMLKTTCPPTCPLVRVPTCPFCRDPNLMLSIVKIADMTLTGIQESLYRLEKVC